MFSSIHWNANSDTLIAAGSWLPWFYNDKKRTFFVLPALINPQPPKPRPTRGAEVNPGAGTDAAVGPLPSGDIAVAGAPAWLYYPQIKHNFRTLENFFLGIVQAWVAQTPLSNLPAAQQAQISAFLHAQFKEEPPPPYTDAQAADLTVRWVMRFFHYYL